MLATGHGVPEFRDVDAALVEPDTGLRLFGKPRVEGHRRVAVTLARDVDVTIIDNDIDMIRSAEEFGFKIYYGDGTRLDVLHASGAHSARAIAVCIDGKESVNKIVELVKAEFPLVRLLVRSYDREHALELINAGVDYQIRETFESAVNFGAAALVELGVAEDEASRIAEEIRRRDAERFELEMAGGGLRAGATSWPDRDLG